MSKDLREFLQIQQMKTEKLSKKHRKNFEVKLRAELHPNKNEFSLLWKIAASVLLIIGVGSTAVYFSKSTMVEPDEIAKIQSLGSISPELKTIENYYLATIQTEILNLEESPENKELLDSYLEKIGELTIEYKTLTKELNEEGLNEKSINALIENLRLRLKLLYQLKEQLEVLKKLNTTENESIQV
jgi:preprotein translocase subunit Sss1